MVEVVDIEIRSIGPWSKNRRILDENVDKLVPSIERSGLIQPITVRPWPEDEVGDFRYQVITGAHRLKACERLNRATIAARIVQATDSQAAMLSYDENCARADPSAAQRAITVGNWRDAFNAENTEDPHQKAAKARHGVAVSEGFVAMVSRTVALHEKTIRRDLKFFLEFGRDDLESVVGTSLDSYSELDLLLELDADRRQELIARAAKGEPVSAKPEGKLLKAAKAAQKRVEKVPLDAAGDIDEREGVPAGNVAEGRSGIDEQTAPTVHGHDADGDPDIGSVGRIATGPGIDRHEAPRVQGSGVHAQAVGSQDDGTPEHDAVGEAPATAAGSAATNEDAALDAFTAAARQRLQQLSEAPQSGDDVDLIEFVGEQFARLESLDGGVVAEAYVEFLRHRVDFDAMSESIAEEMDADANSRIPRPAGGVGSDGHGINQGR